jgi:hypothetical protein
VQPESGGRFEARLLAVETSAARYGVELASAAGVWSGDARVSLAGDVEEYAWTGPGDPPEWLRRYLRAALRAAWRAHGQEGWPRRLTRWREEPDPRRGHARDESDESPR